MAVLTGEDVPGDGEEGLWYARGSDYDVIILDLMLPGAYGLDVLKNLRNDSDLPVLVLSARNDTGDNCRPACRASSFQD